MKSLEEYMKLADDAEDFIHKYAISANISTIDDKILQLQSSIKTLQAVAIRLANVSNVCTKIRKLRTKFDTPMNYVDPYPKSGDHTIIRTMFPKDTQEITKHTKLPVVRVETPEDIPVHPLYYVESMKQFAVSINGIILRGNIGNIEEYQSEKTARCEYGKECKCLTTGCKYYHDPKDYIDKKIPIIHQLRNFTTGSFLYTRNLNSKTYYARHIGSLNTLEIDIARLKKRQFREEINTRQDQLMHDLLILLILHSLGYLEDYPHWPKLS